MSEVLARAVWSGLIEPGDGVAGALIELLGPVEALALVERTAAGRPVDLPVLASAARERLARAIEGWAQRLEPGAAETQLRWLDRAGGRLVVPGSAHWPAGLDDLGPARPICLWVRGDADPGRAVAVVGARASSAYGEHVTADLVGGLVDAGVAVVSGGAYGIDAVAHRAALAGDGRTLAVLAGGVDRPYPAGNARLLDAVAGAGGVLAEVPPGRTPTRHRFLQRNRLIAALAVVTVVVEAAWRSGALSTAGHAAALLRPVAAVPGPVTSASSAGCHRLIREGAVCVTDAAEVLELLDGTPVAPPDAATVTDGLGPHERIVYDALPVRDALAAEQLPRRTGLATPDVLAALGALELAGAVRSDGLRWRRT